MAKCWTYTILTTIAKAAKVHHFRHSRHGNCNFNHHNSQHKIQYIVNFKNEKPYHFRHSSKFFQKIGENGENGDETPKFAANSMPQSNLKQGGSNHFSSRIQFSFSF
jgi:hypothetical protein